MRELRRPGCRWEYMDLTEMQLEGQVRDKWWAVVCMVINELSDYVKF
jgi:hypothetical protein